MSLYYQVTQKQYDLLAGIRYWIADKKRMIERYGTDDPELESIHKTIIALFDECDREKIPFWVQNVAICSVQDEWRNYLNEYTYQALEKRNINCDLVSCR